MEQKEYLHRLKVGYWVSNTGFSEYFSEAEPKLGIKKGKEGKKCVIPMVLFVPLSTAGYKLKQGYTAGSTEDES